LINSSVRMGTGVSNMVNLLTAECVDIILQKSNTNRMFMQVSTHLGC
jgi:hypothetical protein